MKYNTKQYQLITEYLKNNKNKSLTVTDIKEHFEKKQVKIGQTTIYRCLNKLEDKKQIIKFQDEFSKSTSYKYVNETCHLHFHLKCIKCGLIDHLECNDLNVLENHIKIEHKFKIDNTKTIIYGMCCKCCKCVGGVL